MKVMDEVEWRNESDCVYRYEEEYVNEKWGNNEKK